jgi:translation initiation factor 3 subunit H
MSNYDGGDEEVRVKEVCMSGLVALKIIKHCKENIPELVTGQLLGLDKYETLEVTNCFPSQRGGDEEGESDAGRYQIEMMRHLRDVNVDSNTVGWYQSTYLGSFMNLSMLESQFHHQAQIGKCVVVVYDPAKTIQGQLSLQAFRLSNTFMDLYREHNFSPENLATLGKTHTDIFEEIPIKIQNSSLANALLYELESRGVVEKPDSMRLEMTSSQLLQKNLEFMIEESEELISEQNKLQYHYRAVQRQQQQQSKWIQQRKQENAARRRKGQEELPEKGDESDPVWKPIPPPPQLESLLITNQIQYYCEQGNKLLGASLDKHMIMNGLSKR